MPHLKTDAKWVREKADAPLRKRVWDGNVCVGAIEYRVRRDGDGSLECQHSIVVGVGAAETPVLGRHRSLDDALKGLINHFNNAA